MTLRHVSDFVPESCFSWLSGFQIGIYLIFSVFLWKNVLSGSPLFCDVPLIFGWEWAKVASVDHVPGMRVLFSRDRLFRAQCIERELPCLADWDSLSGFHSASLAIKTAWYLIQWYLFFFSPCGDFANRLSDNGRHPTPTKIKMFRFWWNFDI